jgi:type IV secretion system protein VirB5
MGLFGKTRKPPPPESEYTRARREYNELWGTFILQISLWRRVALIALLTALVAVGGVVYLGAQNKLVPYVVEIDNEGAAVAIRRVEQTTQTDPRIIRSMLARFIHDWRCVYVDAAAQRAAIASVYSMLNMGDPSMQRINEFFQQNVPFKRAEAEVVTVAIIGVLQTTEKSYQIDWTEETRNRKGELLKRNTFRASMQLGFKPPTAEAEILRNPIGLFITDLNYSELLKS